MRINFNVITSKLLELSFTITDERRIIANGCHEISIKKDANQINVSIITNRGEIQQLVTFRMSYQCDENNEISLRDSEFIMGTEGIQTQGSHVAAMQLRGEAVVLLSEVADILLSPEVQEHIINEFKSAQRMKTKKLIAELSY